jgi:hypothetical protein
MGIIGTVLRRVKLADISGRKREYLKDRVTGENIWTKEG